MTLLPRCYRHDAGSTHPIRNRQTLCDGVTGIAKRNARCQLITAAASENKPGGKKESIAVPRRAVLVLSSPPKVFNAESDIFKGGPDKISGEVGGVIESIAIDESRIVGVHIAVDQV